MTKLFRQAALLGLIAIVLGGVLNGPQLYRRLLTPPPVGDYAPLPVMRQEVQHWLAQGQLVVDARSSAAYAEGHLPGAHSVPRGDVAAFQALLSCCLQAGQVLVYCSELTCDDSFVVGQQLAEAGFEQVFLYEEGYADWQQAGLPIETGGGHD